MPSIQQPINNNTKTKGSNSNIFEEDLINSLTFLPSSSFNDNLVINFHDFLTRIIGDKDFCKKELGEIKNSDTIETLYRKLNYRIAQCIKFKDDALNSVDKFLNKYVIISEYMGKCDEYDAVKFTVESDLCSKIDKFVEPSKQFCIGYIYRVILDIRTKSFFHIYLRPIIYTDTKGRRASLKEEEIRNVSFEELLKSYKIITKDEYERKIKELFIKNIPDN